MHKLLHTLRLPIILLAIGATAAPAITYAQNAPDRPRAQRNREPQAGRLQDALSQLNLTDEQKARIQPIVQELRRQMRDARQGAAAPGDRRAELRQSAADARKQIIEVLTPEQRTKLAELVREQRGAATRPAAQTGTGLRGGRGGAVTQMQAAALSLNLTPEQQAKVKELTKEYRDEVAAIARDNAGNQATGRRSAAGQQVRTAVQEYRSRLTEILTPEQADQFNKKLDETRAAAKADGAGKRGKAQPK